MGESSSTLCARPIGDSQPSFDAYHKWLGIPPDEQPPNYYRLLGIRPFEDDPEVIEAAADQRMAHLKNYQAGAHSDLSQELLNAVAAAKVSLLTAAKKNAYDTELRQERGPTESKSPSDGHFAEASPFNFGPVEVPARRATATTIPGLNPGLLAISLGALLIVVLSGLLLLGRGGSEADHRVPTTSRTPTKALTITQDRTPPPLPSSVTSTQPPAEDGQPPSDASPPAGGSTSTSQHVVAEATEEGNLLLDGGFEKQPETNWQPRSWRGNAGAVSFEGDVVMAGKRAAMIRSEIADDVALLQKVTVKPHTTYELSGFVRTKDVSIVQEEGTKKGATLAVHGGYECSRSIKGTNDWTCLTLKFNSGNRHELEVGPRLGFYNSTATGTIWVDSLSLQEVGSERGADDAPTTSKGSPVCEKTAVLKREESAPVRLCMPSDEAQAKIASRLRNELKDQYSQAGAASAQVVLAEKMLLRATDPALDATSRFVLFQLARGMAIEAGDCELMMDAIERISHTFDVDAITMKADGLSAFSKAARTPGARRMVSAEELRVLEAALGDGRLVEAKKLLKLVQVDAMKARDGVVARQVRAQARILEQALRMEAEVEEAQQLLKTRPDDPSANLTVGQHVCCVKGDWARGLAMLGKGSDEALKQLAARDASGASDTAAQVALGDSWWGLAAEAGVPFKRQMQLRASFWYQQANSNLSGLAKVKVRSRLDEIKSAQAPSPRRIVSYKDGSTLIPIPAGKFLAGKDKFAVTLPDFYMGLHEVTNAQYKRFMDETGHHPPASGWDWEAPKGWKPNPDWDGNTFRPGKGDHPVTCVNLGDAEAYCRWAGLRLPTELEWEKAAGGADGRKFPWGNDWDPDKCQSRLTCNRQRTSPVISFYEGRSPWGLYNMAGNVKEWCSDRFEADAYARYRRGDLRTPDSQADGGVMRGGGWWDDSPGGLYCAGRDSQNHGIAFCYTGFRVAKSVLH